MTVYASVKFLSVLYPRASRLFRIINILLLQALGCLTTFLMTYMDIDSSIADIDSEEEEEHEEARRVRANEPLIRLTFDGISNEERLER